MRFYAVGDSWLDEAVELFVRCEDAERLVRDWDWDEPEQAGLLRVEVVELRLRRTRRRGRRAPRVVSVWSRERSLAPDSGGGRSLYAGSLAAGVPLAARTALCLFTLTHRGATSHRGAGPKDSSGGVYLEA
jgi:hypothetical protein